MMGASKLAPCLALALAGCAGNVVEGLPRDGGTIDDEEPSGDKVDGGALDRDGGLNVRDASLDAGGRDAGNAREDASTPPQKDAGNAQSQNDAGSTGTALNPGLLARPSNNGRNYSSNPADWAGSPRCSEGTGQGQVVLCDDFESQAAGGFAGPAWTPAGMAVTTSDDEVMRGTKAMRFGPPSGVPGQMQETKTFPTLQNKMFGRVFVYFFTDPPSAPSDALWTLVEVSGGDNTAQVRLGGQIDPNRGNKNFFGVGSDGGDSGDWHTRGLEPESEVKKGAWTCLEWMFDGDANETRVWINNVEQLSLHTTAANYRVGDEEGGKQFIHPTYSSMKIGYWVYQSSASPDPAVVFMDELVLDDEQIGCAL